MVMPEFYSYGGLLISGILESNSYPVLVERDLHVTPKESTRFPIVCLSLQSTRHLFDCRKLLRALKRQKKPPFVVAGGPGVQDPHFAFRILPELDVIVIREGEETILDLLGSCKQNLDDVDGIAYRVDEQVVTTKPRKPPELKDRPLPKMPKDICRQWIRGVNIYVETHRGCFGNCSFCQYCYMFGHTIRSRPLDNILVEIKHMKAQGIRKFATSGGDVSYYGYEKCHDSSLFLRLVKELSLLIGKRGLAGPDLRIDSLTPEILGYVKKYTQGWIFVGIESGSNKILRSISKGINTDDIRLQIELAKDLGVQVSGSFMTGLIFESNDDVMQTKDLIRSLELDNYEICLAEPIPATPYWNIVKASPLSQNPFFELSDEKIGKFRNLTEAEIRAIRLKAAAYETICHKPMSSIVLNQEVMAMRNESRRIRKIIELACCEDS